MDKELSDFAAHLRKLIADGRWPTADSPFSTLALELFALQFERNPAYRKICQARKLTPQIVEHWTQIPFVPAGAFKELELTCIPPENWTAVFHSSGTTEQKPSRHFHCAESLALYEDSLWPWFEKHCRWPAAGGQFIFLAPGPKSAPHSSLVHMFETVRRKIGAPENAFVGGNSADGWTLDFGAALAALDSAIGNRQPAILLGAAFSFVHLLDFLAEKNLRLRLPENSCVMETGGYKNRSREIPKAELHALIEEFLGVQRGNIVCEYGMSELSSQAYAKYSVAFQFPPWARAQIISSETGREVFNGATGLIRIFDLANAFSVAAIQTEDLGIRRGEGFELIGRARLAEPRGCSLMTA